MTEWIYGFSSHHMTIHYIRNDSRGAERPPSPFHLYYLYVIWNGIKYYYLRREWERKKYCFCHGSGAVEWISYTVNISLHGIKLSVASILNHWNTKWTLCAFGFCFLSISKGVEGIRFFSNQFRSPLFCLPFVCNSLCHSSQQVNMRT